MSKNILVTGANGQLGHAMRKLASEYPAFQFHFTDIDSLDICDFQQLDAYFQSHSIQYVLNCAAYTTVDKAEDEVETSDKINHWAVKNIGEAAKRNGAKVIHVSTDYVFDGRKQTPYVEEDPTNPQSAYGRSKLDGEIALQKACPDSIIIRTSWLYSEVGANFVKTMLRLGSEREELNVVSDQIGTPTYAGDLAQAMMSVITTETFFSGVYHYSNEGVCSWYDFAAKIIELAGFNCQVKPILTREYPTKAVRPAYSVFDKQKIKTTFGLEIPLWETSLERCVEKLIKI